MKVADYTIKGFVYQFNKTLEQLLIEPEGSEITVEGIIEDIDIVTPGITKAIQCKYHETKGNYNLSDIAKPILQILVHYSKNIDKNIQYILYAHFPNESLGEKTVSKTDIETIMNTSNKKYIVNYISVLKPPDDTSIEQILSKPKANQIKIDLPIDIKDTKQTVNQQPLKNTNVPLAQKDNISANMFLGAQKNANELGKIQRLGVG